MYRISRLIDMTVMPTTKPLTSHSVSKEKYLEIFKVQTEALRSVHDYLYREGLVQLMPVILSPITDPLNHSVYDASITYQDQELHLTKSMILHKQIALASLDVKGIYIVSPNVRLEKGIQTDRHLLEFSQIDIELKGWSALEFRSFIEDMMVYVFTQVKERCVKALEKLGVEIKIPRRPFRIYSSRELHDEFGPDFESQISQREDNLFWITDFDREFYDKEDPALKGHYVNYDLFYPDGYQEALSGGERDYEFEILIRKMGERDQVPEAFASYLDYAKDGLLGPSAGGGLGIERLIRFLTKRTHIREVTLFPKVPDEPISL
ncbi:MAG: asparagine synthetase A [Candidatus Thorarchaeota archaeon]